MSHWYVEVKKKVAKRIQKLPRNIQERAATLVQDLKQRGVCPGKNWKNFSSLGENKYHCHLTYSYVACWEEIDGTLRIIEVYYVGSREDAPY